MSDLRPVGYVIGLLVAALGATMLLPFAADLWEGEGHWPVFLGAAALTGLAGGSLALACQSGVRHGLTIQQSFLLTTGTWALLPLFGAIPFMLGAPHASLTDAYFEAMSGLTTTGSTVFTDLDHLPAGTLLWRGLLQWLGGLGIVIVAMVFLPVMKVGGMQYFRSESFDTLGKILPRALDISNGLIRVYLMLTLGCATTYFALGMGGFDAMVHALTTVSTGGFANSDGSFAAYAGPIEYASAAFMLLASMPFIRFVQLSTGNWRPLWRDVQVRAYLRWAAYAIAAITVYEVWDRGAPLFATLRETTFNVVTIFSGTGYTSVDIGQWGPFPFIVVFTVGMIGGCTASTGCSIKVFRFLILFEAVRTQIRRILRPNAVLPVRLEGRPVGEDVINSVIVLFTAFVVTFGVVAVGLSFIGLNSETAVTAAWTSVFNIGPAFGPGVGPTGAMDGFPPSAKWLMAFGMLGGRLEMLSVFVLFVPRFWRA
ncbi:TrkH family potassium uptake protein [Acidimangrovimonas sediminis]|uniref:TrkH family potassium uptake protein n=1 Tax=Acidimangrovimonas sediminis TaxID=2056283 RepID=UPI000C7FD4E5|nr:TrkH family potassium uptake protein [Acidimangrovimonas sediminis]